MTGYHSTFVALQYALMIVTDYICADGHRIRCRTVEIDWQTANFVWC